MWIKIQTHVAVLAHKPQREPALPLPAILPLQRHTDQLRWQVVDQPIRVLTDDLGTIRADLLRQLTQYRAARILPLINATLWQLPAARRAFSIRQIGTPRDEHQPVGIEQHGPDIRAIRQHAHGLAFGRVTSALTGANTAPRAGRLPAHAFSCASVRGWGALTRP